MRRKFISLVGLISNMQKERVINIINNKKLIVLSSQPLRVSLLLIILLDSSWFISGMQKNICLTTQDRTGVISK